MNKKILLLSGVLLFFITAGLFGQTVPVGSLLDTEDAIRRQQLLGNDTSNSSFMIRPINLSEKNNLDLYNDGSGLQDWNKKLVDAPGSTSGLYLLPVVWKQQINSHHPYGMNDGAMIPAKGYQTMLSAGIFGRLGFVSVQLRPEFVYAYNAHFRQTYELNNGPSWPSAYAAYYNSIDAPERFGSGRYTNFNWGQSSIRLNFDPVSFGLSNENLWWGPGVRNSLLMSNNAPGFKHLTLNTSRPINTGIGAFEGQLVSGRLESSGIENPSGPLYRPKNQDWIYFSGIAITYQPKWIKGLYLGFDRSFIVNSDDLNGFGDYFPIFSAVQKNSAPSSAGNGGAAEDQRRRDQRISFFARWLMPEANAEVYFQFGKNDHNYDSRDAFVEPEHNRAYIAGVRKLLPLNRTEEYIQIGLELTQLEGAPTRQVRSTGYWYNHSQVARGYTNLGQVLGAGIGSGSNLQSLDVSWVKGLKKIGLQVERTVQNNDLFYRMEGPIISDLRKHWVDLTLKGRFNWDFNNFVVNTQLAYIRSLNYQYAFENPTADYWIWDKQDANNLHFQVGLMYRW